MKRLTKIVEMMQQPSRVAQKAFAWDSVITKVEERKKSVTDTNIRR